MIDFIWSGFMALSWVVVLIWMTPTIIAYKRDHRNKIVIFVMSVIISVIPTTLFMVMGYLLLLGFSLYRSPDVMVVQGPQGERGPAGKDADEIPLSKSGVLKPRKK